MPGAAALVLALTFLATGCGGEGRNNLPGELVDGFDEKRVEVERRKRFPLYYLGESHKGFALTYLGYDRDPWHAVSFVYGSCEPSGFIADGGCAPPLEVQVEPTCLRGRKRLEGELRQTVRGVPAGPLQGWYALHTGTALIRIIGRGRRGAADALRPLGAQQPSGNLPPPARRGGARPCRP